MVRLLDRDAQVPKYLARVRGPKARIRHSDVRRAVGRRSAYNNPCDRAAGLGLVDFIHDCNFVHPSSEPDTARKLRQINRHDRGIGQNTGTTDPI